MYHWLRDITLSSNAIRTFVHFRITLKSVRSQCHGQEQSLTTQLISRPLNRIELCRKVCTVKLKKNLSPEKFLLDDATTSKVVQDLVVFKNIEVLRPKGAFTPAIFLV